MKHENYSLRKLAMLGIALAVLPLSACAGGGAAYVPIIDGPQNAKFQQDIAQCQALAEQRSYNNSDVKTGAVAGAAVGAVAGLLRRGNSNSDPLIGGAVGGVYGGGGAALGTRTERKNIVKRCMSGRGHRVLG